MNCPPPPYTYSFFTCSCPERISQYVSEHMAWADKIYRRFVNLRTDYQKPEHRKKPGQLTARQLWKLKHLSYLKPYYKQCHKSRKDYQGTGAIGGAAITSMEQESDDDHEPKHEERGHESSSSSRKETPTKIPVLSSPLPLRKPKKRRDTDKEEKVPSFNELMDVMKESASHLMSQRTRSANPHDRERESFFQWLNDFTSRMSRQNWRDFQRTSVNLAMQYTPAEYPQPNTSRQRIQQGPSASSHAHHPMDPPPRPAPRTSGGYMEMLQSQQYAGGLNPTQMVSTFLLYLFLKFLL